MKRMKTVLILATALCISGCATPKWDATEKGMMAVVVAANIADGYTTHVAMEAGGFKEASPFYGPHASTAEIVAGKALTVAVTAIGAEMIPSHRWRKVALGASALISGGAAWHNYQLLKSHGAK